MTPTQLSTLSASVKRGDRKPVHLQLAESLQRLIETGALAQGDSLPSESDVRRTLRVSPATIKKAIALLIRRRLVRRTDDQRLVVAPPSQTSAHSRKGRRFARRGSSYPNAAGERAERPEEFAEDELDGSALGFDHPPKKVYAVLEISLEDLPKLKPHMDFDVETEPDDEDDHQ